MANRRILVKRRKAAQNIRKITRTMQLIATARFQSAYNRATATKPYTQKLAELVADLSMAAEDLRHPLMETPDVKRSAVMVLTTSRGFCGAYNSNVLRTALEFLDKEALTDSRADVQMVGKKGISFFRFLGREMVEEITHIGETPTYEQVEPLANDLMDRFSRGEISAVHVVYMRFVSAGRQRPHVAQLLPLVREESPDDALGVPGQYEFSPDPGGILDELLPATVRSRLFEAFNDAAVSEQMARMVAMKAATDAAGEMIKTLTRQYNRARQSQITMELLDIVGGADALA